MNYVKEHNFKPGDIVLIKKRPSTYSSLLYSNNGLYSHQYPLIVTVDKIDLNKTGNHSMFKDTNGFGWTVFDYFELASPKLFPIY